MKEMLWMIFKTTDDSSYDLTYIYSFT